jgi:protein CpxP
MKNLILILFLFIASNTYLHAQQGQPKNQQTPDEKADEVVAKLKTDIALTDEQAPKVKTITLDRINKVTEARKKHGADKPRLQAAQKLIFEEWETQLKSIVSEDQYNKYLATKK